MRRFLYPIVYPFFQLYWQVFHPKTFGVKVIIEQNGKLLLIKNSYGGSTWTLTGGGIKKGESPIEAAVREAREEVGINFETRELKELGSYVTDHEGKIDTVHVFHAMTGNQSKIDQDEVIQAEWFSKEGLPENLGVQAKKSLAVWK